MLANNIVRVNGWRQGKRAHADLEVRVIPNETNWGKGKEMPVYDAENLVDRCFAEGLLDGVTSINAYNYVADHRITSRI